MSERKLNNEQQHLIAHANRFQEELVGRLKASEERLRHEVGELHQFLPPIQLLSNESEYLIQTYEGLIGTEECERAFEAYFAHNLTRAYVRTRQVGQYADPFKLTWKVTPQRVLDACTYLVEPEARIEVSFGTFLALQDIALRMVSSENFYNPYPQDALAGAHWRGGVAVHLSAI